MKRRIAVVGDKLERGGQILPYVGPVFTIGDAGHQAALTGGTAYCEACKTTGLIAKAGGSHRINFLGETAADRDIVLCGCSTPPRIVAVLAGNAWCDDGDDDAVTPSTDKVCGGTASGNTTHDEQYTLTDVRGRRLVGIPYRVRLSSQILLTGITDASGKTRRISTDGMKRIYLDIAH